MSMLGATILTAIATLVLAVLAFVTAIFAGLAFRKQSQEVRAIVEERKREAEDRQRGQATGVTAWLDHDPHPMTKLPMLVAVISNQSCQPIYDIQTSVRYLPDDQPGTRWEPFPDGSSHQVDKILPSGNPLHVVLPGESFPQEDEPDGRIYGVGVAFTDAAGNRWERGPSGSLSLLS